MQWRFALDPENLGVEQQWFAPDFDDSDWARIRVGDYWERQGYEDYDGIAWYRLPVEITEDDVAEPLLLGFGGVDAAARVYLNGEEIGEHDGWDEPFAVEVPRDLVRVGEQNLIAVRVSDTSANGGIYGTVSLARRK
ncbi:MAG: sugar-binding domain-containing protein, partial [Armatimonadota bacterium]